MNKITSNRIELTFMRTAATALLGLALAISVVGCEKKPAAPPTPHAKAPSNSTSESAAGSGLADAVGSAAASLGLDAPDMQIPSLDEIESTLEAQITDANADAAFQDLEKDIESDSSQ
jgi:hypothetical protein